MTRVGRRFARTRYTLWHMRREDDGVEKRADGADRPRETLRERKRRETREAIERAAISLVDELGYEGVTVAMICDRAVVSQGTFFNYFPTKDAAIVGIPAAPLDVDAVRAAYDSQASSTPFSVTLALFLEVVRALDRASDIAAMRWRLVSQTPALMRLFWMARSASWRTSGICWPNTLRRAPIGARVPMSLRRPRKPILSSPRRLLQRNLL